MSKVIEGPLASTAGGAGSGTESEKYQVDYVIMPGDISPEQKSHFEMRWQCKNTWCEHHHPQKLLQDAKVKVSASGTRTCPDCEGPVVRVNVTELLLARQSPERTQRMSSVLDEIRDEAIRVGKRLLAQQPPARHSSSFPPSAD
jgi:hypothetical protein